jgi:hypothetical protein
VNACLLAALCTTLLEPLDAERVAHSSVSLALTAYSTEPTTVGFDNAAAVRIDAIWIALQDARVWPRTSCKRSSAKAVISGTFTAELISKLVHGSAPAELDLGRYCAFEVQLRRSRGKVAGAPADLRGASIVIEGRRADGAQFVLRARLETAPLLRANELEGFTVGDARTSWIVGVDVARWLSGVDLGSAETTADGEDRKVRIDDKTNAELLDRFNANVAGGFALFADRNADRNLDPDERATPIAVGR